MVLHATSSTTIDGMLALEARGVYKRRFIGAPLPAAAASSPPIAQYMRFRDHIWNCAAVSLRAPPPRPATQPPTG